MTLAPLPRGPDINGNVYGMVILLQCVSHGTLSPLGSTMEHALIRALRLLIYDGDAAFLATTGPR